MSGSHMLHDAETQKGVIASTLNAFGDLNFTNEAIPECSLSFLC